MARTSGCSRGIVVVVVAIAGALMACGGRSPAPKGPRPPASSIESSRESTPAADARATEVEATTTDDAQGSAQAEPPPELACGRCERVGDACGEWWEDGDDAGRTYAALIPCDPRCCR